MSEMKCKRCGADENRIDGFCSIECRDAFDYEEEIAELQDANTELHSRIAELEEKQRWIPVSERLPEDGKPVWVCTIWNEQHSGFLIDGVWVGLFRDFREGEITHWMPLPKLPEVTE